MRQSIKTRLNFKQIAILSILMFLGISSTSFAQFGTQEYFITNKQSKKVLDVRGGSQSPRAQVWQYDLNYTEAQRYRFFRRRASGDGVFMILAKVSNLYVSVKINNEQVKGTHVPKPRRYRQFTRYETIWQDKKYNETTSRFQKISFGANYKHQRWKFIPVPNEARTFYIQSTAFSTKKVLEPASTASGATMRLADYTGSEKQKWIIKPVLPGEPTDVSINDFKWQPVLHKGKVVGNVRWKDNANSEDGFEIRMKKEGESSFKVIGTVGRNKTSFSFSKNVDLGRNKEFCFKVIPFNRWGKNASDEACAVARHNNTSPQPKGYKKVAIYNCHSEKKTVRLWSYDLTANTGVWKSHGTFGSQWSNGNCSSGSPKEISLSNGHKYIFKAIDCGSKPPNQTNGSCHKMTSAQILGDSDGYNSTTITIQ